MKNVFTIAMMFLLLLPLAGCEQQKFTPAQLIELAAQVDTLTNQLTMYQTQVTQLAAQMQEDGILSDEDAEKVATLNAQIDGIKEKIGPVVAAIKAGTYDPNDDAIITILKVAQAANAATVSFNPYATYISMGLSAVIFILGMFAKKKAAEAAIKGKALTEVVMGGETFKALAPPEAVAKFEDAQRLNQSESTKIQVKTITA
jgi:outer membrane murein-binding lipoprotein Lpp